MADVVKQGGTGGSPRRFRVIRPQPNVRTPEHLVVLGGFISIRLHYSKDRGSFPCLDHDCLTCAVSQDPVFVRWYAAAMHLWNNGKANVWTRCIAEVHDGFEYLIRDREARGMVLSFVKHGDVGSKTIIRVLEDWEAKRWYDPAKGHKLLDDFSVVPHLEALFGVRSLFPTTPPPSPTEGDDDRPPTLPFRRKEA